MKHGWPDQWGILERPREWKRGEDRLSENQKENHRAYRLNTGSYPLVIYIDESKPSHYFVFQSFMDFDEWLSGRLPFLKSEEIPELDEYAIEEYGVEKDNVNESSTRTTIQAEVYRPDFNEPLPRRGGKSREKLSEGGASRPDQIPFRDR